MAKVWERLNWFHETNTCLVVLIGIVCIQAGVVVIQIGENDDVTSIN